MSEGNRAPCGCIPRCGHDDGGISEATRVWRELGSPTLEGISDDVRLTVTTAAGPVLDMALIMAAIMARAGNGEILPFIYRDPYDPDDPDETPPPRPLRRARLVIIDDGVIAP